MKQKIQPSVRTIPPRDTLETDLDMQHKYVERLKKGGERSFALIAADAFVRGMVFIQFLETDGTTAAGVSPTILDGAAERPLVLGDEVRFLAADRLTILGPTQTVTTPSGVAIVLLARPTGIDANDSFAADLGGTRATDIWADQPSVFANGFIFMLRAQLP